MDVNGNDNNPEWGWCKHDGCSEPAEPLWFTREYPDDPDLLLCYKHTGEWVGDLVKERNEARRMLIAMYKGGESLPSSIFWEVRGWVDEERP